jgi:hypothetical protein
MVTAARQLRAQPGVMTRCAKALESSPALLRRAARSASKAGLSPLAIDGYGVEARVDEFARAV